MQRWRSPHAATDQVRVVVWVCGMPTSTRGQKIPVSSSPLPHPQGSCLRFHKASQETANSVTHPSAASPTHLLFHSQTTNSYTSIPTKLCFWKGFPDSSVGKESTCNAGDPSSIPGSGRSPGEGIGYPTQYS